MNSFSLFIFIYKNVIIYIDYFSLRSIMELLWRKRIMYKTESFKPDTFKPARFESDGKLHCQEKKFHIIQFVKTMSSMDQMEIQSHQFSRMPILEAM